MLRLLRAPTASAGGRRVFLSRAAGVGALPARVRMSTSAAGASSSLTKTTALHRVGAARTARAGSLLREGATTTTARRSSRNALGAAVRTYRAGTIMPSRPPPSLSLSTSPSSPRLVMVFGAPVVAALCVDPTLPLRAVESLSRQRRYRRAASCEARRPARTAAKRRRRRGEESSQVAGAGEDDDGRGRRWSSVQRRLARVVRAWIRAVQLLLTMGPAVALYPVGRLLSSSSSSSSSPDGANSEDNCGGSGDGGLPDWYLNLCLRLAEHSGAAVVKLLQWASSRPDLFGESFCAVFERLQDRTTPHDLEYTERALREAYGEDWEERIRLGEVLGSGCIGQVYKGIIQDEHGAEQEVAVKVMHPGIHGNIDADLDLLRFLASLAESIPFDIGERIRWLDLPGTVEEFASLLTLQLDFRTEAENLRRFNENFADDDRIMFPELVDTYRAQRDVLIETFCEGQPVFAFLRENDADPSVRANLCATAIDAVCRMIFDHNFIHGDLHPGNILVCPRTHRFILLDAGMVTEYDDDDHERIVQILTSFIRKDGRRAGELMISDSKARTSATTSLGAGEHGEVGSSALKGSGGGDNRVPVGSVVLHEEAYKDKIEALTIQASGPDYFMEHLGTYITYICNAASTHHVMMNPAFVSAALAVKVQEGVAIALDPSVEIWRIANPIILQSEFRRNLYKLRDRVFGGMLGIVPRTEDWEHAQDLASLSGLTL